MPPCSRRRSRGRERSSQVNSFRPGSNGQERIVLPASTRSPSPPPGGLGTQARLLLAQLRSGSAEVLGLEELADLDLRAAVEGGPLEPLDRLFLRLALPQPESGDQLLRLGE